MESLAIGMWIVGGVVGAPLFCFVLSRFIRPHATIARLLFWASIAGLSIFVLDIMAVAMFGAITTRRRRPFSDVGITSSSVLPPTSPREYIISVHLPCTLGSRRI